MTVLANVTLWLPETFCGVRDKTSTLPIIFKVMQINMGRQVTMVSDQTSLEDGVEGQRC